LTLHNPAVERSPGKSSILVPRDVGTGIAFLFCIPILKGRYRGGLDAQLPFYSIFEKRINNEKEGRCQ
jgi:hypothetical protein